MTVKPSLDFPIHEIDFYLSEPWEAYARLRRDCPVYWSEPLGYFSFFGYEEIQLAFRNPEIFSSAKGMTRQSVVNQIVAGSISTSDPPVHTDLRRKVNRGLTVRAVAQLEPFARDLIGKKFDELKLHQEYEFVEELALVLPLTLICELLGVSTEHYQTLAAFNDALMDENQDLENEDGEGPDAILDAFVVISELVQEHLANPGDNLISRIAAPDENGERLTDEDVLKFVLILFGAGFDTTRALLSRSMYEFTRHPDQRNKLIADPTALPVAIEEMLRFGSTAGELARTTTRDLTLKGMDIPAGSVVLLNLPSGNRDETVFGEDSHEMRIDRDPNPHIAFGTGEHFCLGAGLARLQTRIFFEELLARFSAWECPGVPVPFRSFEFHRAFRRLPIVFTEAATA